MELAAGRVDGALFFFGCAVREQWSAFFIELREQQFFDGGRILSLGEFAISPMILPPRRQRLWR